MKKLLATVLLVAFCASFTVADATLRLDVAKAMADTPLHLVATNGGSKDALLRFDSAKNGPEVVLAASRAPRRDDSRRRMPPPPRRDEHRPPPPPRPPRRRSSNSDVEKVVIGLIIGAMIAGAAASGNSAN